MQKDTKVTHQNPNRRSISYRVASVAKMISMHHHTLKNRLPVAF
jgi:hypothetical protein